MTEEEKILRKAQGYTIYEHQGKDYLSKFRKL